MAYHIEFTEKSNDDIEAFKKAGNKAVLKKLLTLIEELYEHPFSGTGKPEPLKHSLTNCWSRRINREHRLVYEVVDDIVYIHSAKRHYK